MSAEWWTVVVGGIGLLGGVVGFARSVITARRVRDIEGEVATALRRAATASEDSATALKRANQIAEDALPRDGAQWGHQHVNGTRHVLKNIGTRTAEGVTIHDLTESGNERSGWLRHSYDAPVDVEPGDLLELTVLSANGSPNVKVELRWHEGNGPLLTDRTTILVR